MPSVYAPLTRRFLSVGIAETLQNTRQKRPRQTRPLLCARPEVLLQRIQDSDNRVEGTCELGERLRVCRCEGKPRRTAQSRPLRALEFRTADEVLQHRIAARTALQLADPVARAGVGRTEEYAPVEAAHVVRVRCSPGKVLGGIVEVFVCREE